MTDGHFIAIAGIWIGTGLSSLGGGEAVSVVAFFALLATIVVLNH